MKTQLRSMIKGNLRKEQVEAGAYDGRFAPKVFVDKRKQAERKACRKFKKDLQSWN